MSLKTTSQRKLTVSRLNSTNAFAFITLGSVLNLDAGNINSYPGTGTTWYDVSGNNNNGTLTNGPTFSAGNLGSIVFDGTNDYVTLSPVIQNFTSFTFLAWVKPTGNLTSNYNGIIFQGHESYPPSDSQSFHFYVNTNVGGGYGWGGETRYAMPISVNNTYMLSVTVTSTQTIQYINSQIQSTFNYSTVSNFNSTRAFQIGKSIGYPGFLSTSYFAGNIFNMIVYNRALSTNEIQQNYNATKGRFGL
jgi:hypothetical protein